VAAAGVPDDGRLSESRRGRLIAALLSVVLLSEIIPFTYSLAIVFWAGTLICAITSSWPLFLVGRGLEAIAIGMSALGYSLVRDVFPRSWVPVTIGFIGTRIGISGVAAPLIGGALTDHYSWRSVWLTD
jgi:MFS family permease